MNDKEKYADFKRKCIELTGSNKSYPKGNCIRCGWPLEVSRPFDGGYTIGYCGCYRVEKEGVKNDPKSA
jgi:hypothetical protein